MHASIATILNVFLCMGLGAAQIIPHQPRSGMMEPPMAMNAPAPVTPAMVDPVAANAARESGAPAPGGAGTTAAGGGSTNALCAQGTMLTQGIALNIADQQQELTTANQLASILAANPVDTAAYGAARTDLLKFINNGIAIRQMNQLITPQENQATSGIATVANAQLTELGLANNLTVQGSDNVAGNMQIVRTLQMDFMGGIQQNMKNIAAATTACGGAAPAAPPPPAPSPQPPAPSPQPPARASQPPNGGPQPPAGGSQPPTCAPQPPAGGPQPPAGGPQPPAGGPQPPTGAPQPPAGGPQPPAGAPQPPAGAPQPPAAVPPPPAGAPPPQPRAAGPPAGPASPGAMTPVPAPAAGEASPTVKDSASFSAGEASSEVNGSEGDEEDEEDEEGAEAGKSVTSVGLRNERRKLSVRSAKFHV